MIILLRIFKRCQSKKEKSCENEIIISYFAYASLPLRKKNIRFTWVLKQEFECFIWNVLLRHYINEFVRIINSNNLNETFQAYRKNYFIVKKKESFFLVIVTI